RPSGMRQTSAARTAPSPRDALVGPECGALPLYADMGGVIGIRPDGTLVEWSHDGGGRDARPVEDRIGVLIALVAAARRYPEFQKLLPVRGPGAIDCDCRRIPQCVSGLISCGQCGGMGWLAGGGPPALGRAGPARPGAPPPPAGRPRPAPPPLPRARGAL